ncbi:peroxiredoxin [Gordonia crocea]|uniref:Alkyl hydroperoxide reductase E n=1 Tax=Gordonia crocea TaxID=589162 RepID=A0A7I9V0C5_9ACTN|nr:peroxiredoxin [Gordonia crocea]GED98520.1 putative peroxiredoxin [Gordonia crocea]
MRDLIAVGDLAPDFTLPDQNNRRVNLAALAADRQVLLVFFPLAFTGNCEGELALIRDREPEFDNESLTTVALSVGPPPTHKVWSSAQGFLFPLLSDFWPHGAVAQQYGVFSEQHGYPLRGTVLVDRDRRVRFSDVAEPGAPRDETVWERALSLA